MGQLIEVQARAVGDTAILDTDRTFNGQEGESYGTRSEAETVRTYAAELSVRLFDIDNLITNVFVLSNVVSVQRAGGWDEQALAKATEATRNFFVVYEENRDDG